MYTILKYIAYVLPLVMIVKLNGWGCNELKVLLPPYKYFLNSCFYLNLLYFGLTYLVSYIILQKTGKNNKLFVYYIVIVFIYIFLDTVNRGAFSLNRSINFLEFFIGIFIFNFGIKVWNFRKRH